MTMLLWRNNKTNVSPCYSTFWVVYTFFLSAAKLQFMITLTETTESDGFFLNVFKQNIIKTILLRIATCDFLLFLAVKQTLPKVIKVTSLKSFSSITNPHVFGPRDYYFLIILNFLRTNAKNESKTLISLLAIFGCTGHCTCKYVWCSTQIVVFYNPGTHTR